MKTGLGALLVKKDRRGWAVQLSLLTTSRWGMQWLWSDLAQDRSQKPNLPQNLSLRSGPVLGIHSMLRALSKHNN